MGVRYLSTYVESRTHLLAQRIQFDGTEPAVPLVVDGFALLHHAVALAHDIDWVHGGDPIAFAETIDYIYVEWKRAGLAPILVWDGMHPTVKLETTLMRGLQKARVIDTVSRASGRLQEAMAKDTFSDFILPSVFLKVTIERTRAAGLQQYFSLEEADTDCCGMAEILDGFVTSQDSDFYIMGMQSRGYIPLSTMIYPIKSGPVQAIPDGFTPVGRRQKLTFRPDDTSHLSAAVFPNEALAEHLGLDVYLMPFLASLLGNDFVPHELTKEFRTDSRYGLPRNGQAQFEARLYTISRLLRENKAAFGDHSSITQGLKTICSYLLRSQRESERTASMVSLVLESLDQYLLQCPPKFAKQVHSGQTARQKMIVRRGINFDIEHDGLEPWKTLYLDGRLSFKLLHLLKYREFWYPLFLEHADPMPAYQVTKKLVQTLTILTAMDGLVDDVKVYARGRPVNCHIEEDDSELQSLIKAVAGRPVCTWCAEDRKECIQKTFALGFTIIEELSDWLIGICALRYLIKTTHEKGTLKLCRLEVAAIICAFYTSAKAWRNFRDGTEEGSTPVVVYTYPLSKGILHRVGQLGMTLALVDLFFQLMQSHDFVQILEVHQIFHGKFLWHYLKCLEDQKCANEEDAITFLMELTLPDQEVRQREKEVDLIRRLLNITTEGMQSSLVQPSPFIKRSRPGKRSKAKKHAQVLTDVDNHFAGLSVDP